MLFSVLLEALIQLQDSVYFHKNTRISFGIAKIRNIHTTAYLKKENKQKYQHKLNLFVQKVLYEGRLWDASVLNHTTLETSKGLQCPLYRNLDPTQRIFQCSHWFWKKKQHTSPGLGIWSQ